MKLHSRLKKARLDIGATQADIAKFLNISRQAISRWETGRAYPDIDHLIALSDYYQVSTDSLLKGKTRNYCK